MFPKLFLIKKNMAKPKIKKIDKKEIKVMVSDLKEYRLNNKDHPQIQIDEIKRSIIDAGYISNICVDENLEILTWHGRKEALTQLEVKEIEVTQVKGLSDKEKRIYRIRDNKIGELGISNADNLKFELIDLDYKPLNTLCDLTIDLDPEGISNEFTLPSNDKGELCNMTFTVSTEQKEQIEIALEEAKLMGDFVETNNNNKNGNCLSRVCELFNGKNWD